MVSPLKKYTKPIVILMLGLALLCSFTVLDLRAGRCEDALVRCLYDVPYTNPWLCATGWAFCKKYIQ